MAEETGKACDISMDTSTDKRQGGFGLWNINAKLIHS